MCPSAYASCRRCTALSRSPSLIRGGVSSDREVIVSLYVRTGRRTGRAEGLVGVLSFEDTGEERAREPYGRLTAALTRRRAHGDRATDHDRDPSRRERGAGRHHLPARAA